MFLESKNSDGEWPQILTAKEIRDAKIRLWFFLTLAFFICFFIAGCVSAPVTLPTPTVESCPKLSMPPIPQKVDLHINGDKMVADDGGDILLRGYVRARELLR